MQAIDEEFKVLDWICILVMLIY